MGVCTGISALQLAAIGASFLLAVLCLDMFWVKLPEELHNGDIAPTLKRQSLLNMFVAFGASAAAVMLMIWVSACGVVAGKRGILLATLHSARSISTAPNKRSPALGCRASLCTELTRSGHEHVAEGTAISDRLPQKRRRRAMGSQPKDRRRPSNRKREARPRDRDRASASRRKCPLGRTAHPAACLANVLIRRGVPATPEPATCWRTRVSPARKT